MSAQEPRPPHRTRRRAASSTAAERLGAESLRGFPGHRLRGERVIHRIHRAGIEAWWFSSDGSGRFDPPPDSGKGTCYLAERPLGAWVEVFRKDMLIAESDVAGRELMSVALGRDVRLADLTSRRALQFGVTATLGAGEDYGESRAFARRAIACGFDGIRYLLRHDPSQRLYGVALFNQAGAVEAEDPHWPDGRSESIPSAVVAEAERTFRYRVLPTP